MLNMQIFFPKSKIKKKTIKNDVVFGHICPVLDFQDGGLGRRPSSVIGTGCVIGQ